MTARAARDPRRAPMSIYEVHLGSWRRGDGNRWLTYDELAGTLVPYAVGMGFTHLELMPVNEHPLDDSWGYQPIGLFAPTSRYRGARRVRALRRSLPWGGTGRDHRLGAGALPGRPARPRAGSTARRSTSTPIRGSASIPTGARPSSTSAGARWRTTSSRARSSGSTATTSTGCASTRVASMLYLDYSRKEGEWLPNRHGGNENLEAVAFLRRLNETVYARASGARSRSPRNRRRGRRCRSRRSRAASASGSSGTWAGCTTRSNTWRRSRCTGAGTTTA